MTNEMTNTSKYTITLNTDSDFLFFQDFPKVMEEGFLTSNAAEEEFGGFVLGAFMLSDCSDPNHLDYKTTINSIFTTITMDDIENSEIREYLYDSMSFQLRETFGDDETYPSTLFICFDGKTAEEAEEFFTDDTMWMLTSNAIYELLVEMNDIEEGCEMTGLLYTKNLLNVILKVTESQ